MARLAGDLVAGPAEVGPQSAAVLQLRGEIEDARPWSPAGPDLYTLALALDQDGATVDRVDTGFGVRRFAVRGTRLCLNDEPVTITGFDRHEEYAGSGRVDPGGVLEADLRLIKELGGNTFQVTGLFVIPAGIEKAEDVKVGDMVLAEWASSLKHAIVTKVEAPDKITVRYTDLPEKWDTDEARIKKTLSPREVTKQEEGLHPGNFAIAAEEDRPIQVLLVSQSGDKWLARRFAGRVGVFDAKNLKPIPLKPDLKVGQTVQAPWVGMMYPGKVKKVSGTRVEVAIEGIATKAPVVTSVGQVAPE
jgi:hypothetical protein